MRACASDPEPSDFSGRFCRAAAPASRCSRCKPLKLCNAACCSCFKSAWKTRRLESRFGRNRPLSASDATAYGRIFVSIVAYRDPELTKTLKSMLYHCERPDLVHVGLVWQGDREDGEPVSGEGLSALQKLWNDGSERSGESQSEIRIPSLPGHPKLRAEGRLGGRLRVICMPAGEARGPCWARYLAQLLWGGEELYLQLDSHMRFVPSWDEKARSQLKMCSKYSKKPVLCSYGRGYPLGMHYTEIPQNLTACLNCAGFFDGNNILNIRYRSLARDWDEPRASFFWSAHFSFSSADILREVPYDPRLLMLFFGEEILMTVRLFTHGWDLFSPCSGLVYHLWQRDYRRVYAEDMRDLYRVFSQGSRKRLHALLGSGPGLFFEEARRWPLPGCSVDAHGSLEASFDLGSARSLSDYEEAAGVSFRDRRLSDFALRGGAPSEECFLTQEEGGQRAVEMQCRVDMPAEKYQFAHVANVELKYTPGRYW